MISPDILRQASVFYDQARYSDCLDLLKAPNLDPPKNLNIALIVAASYFHLSDYRNALLWCQACYSSESENPKYLSLYAATLRRCGEYAESKTIFEHAIKLFPGNLELLNNYSNLLADLGNYDQAMDVLQRILRKDPSYTDADINLKRILTLASHQQSLHPRSPSSIINSNPLFAAFDDDEVTKRHATPATLPQEPRINPISLDLPTPNSTELLSDILRLAQQLSTSKPHISLKYCNAALQQHGLVPEAYIIAGSSYISLKQFQDAELSYLCAVALGSTSAEIYVNLANFACLRGDTQLADLWLSRLDKNTPGSIDPKIISTIKSNISANALNPFQLPVISSTP
jgi:tetratricopeptide (TPR) repeat protein